MNGGLLEGEKQFGVKPWLLYDYNRRTNRNAEQAAVSGGAEPQQGQGLESTPPIPVALPGDVGELIHIYRRDHPGHGFKRIQDLLKQKHLGVRLFWIHA